MAQNYDTADATVPVLTLEPSPGKPRDTPREAKGGFLGVDFTEQSTTNTQISDSYNSTQSTVNSNSVGDSSLTIGSGGGVGDVVPVVVGAIALLGAIYLFTRS
jgi:hypothetical protein